MIKKENLVSEDIFQWAIGFRPPYWDDDTIYYTKEDMNLIWPMLEQAQPHANYYGATLFYREHWEKLQESFKGLEGAVKEIAAELTAWIEAAYQKDDCITIYGFKRQI